MCIFSLLCNCISFYLMFNYFHCLIMLIVTINYLLTYLLIYEIVPYNIIIGCVYRILGSDISLFTAYIRDCTIQYHYWLYLSQTGFRHIAFHCLYTRLYQTISLLVVFIVYWVQTYRFSLPIYTIYCQKLMLKEKKVISLVTSTLIC